MLCESVIGQSAEFKPVLCKRPGVRIGDVVKCTKHWDASRKRADKIAKAI